MCDPDPNPFARDPSATPRLAPLTCPGCPACSRQPLWHLPSALLKRREIAHWQCLSLAGPRSYCTYSQVVVDGGNPIYISRSFWKGLGLWGSGHAVSRGCDLCAIEPCWRMSARAPVSALSWRRGEHALLFTLSGGLSPPPVLGAESTRTSSKQVCCPLLVPSALPHSTLIRRLRVHTRCLIHFCVRFRLLLWRIEEP